MTILYRPGKLYGSAESLLRIDTMPCPHEDCPEHGHLIKIVKSPSMKKPRLLCAIKTRNQDGSQDLNTISDLVPSLRVGQKWDPELCRFMELLHEHAVKPNSKLLTAEPPDVKVLCSLWYKFRVHDLILYRTDMKHYG